MEFPTVHEMPSAAALDIYIGGLSERPTEALRADLQSIARGRMPGIYEAMAWDAINRELANRAGSD